MSDRIIRTPADLRSWRDHLGTLDMPITVTAAQGEDRTLAQNRLSHKWYAEAGRLDGWTAVEARRESKLRIGVPILRGDDTDFREMYDKSIKPLTYEQKLEVMDFLPVTSLMKVKAMAQYMDTVFAFWTEKGAVLTLPEPL